MTGTMLAMSNHVVLVHGLVDGPPTPFDGQYLVSFDFDDCEPGECNLVTTPDPTKARVFEDIAVAFQLWKTLDLRQPTRPDGKPNRPFTAFSISLELVP